MKVIAIIPCRYASTRFEGKPLELILGKPMIQWVYERTKQAADLTDVVVATDDDRIYACVKGFGGRVLMTASTHRSGSDRAAEAAQALGLQDEDIVINIQGDQPAFDPRCLPRLVSPLIQDLSDRVEFDLYPKISHGLGGLNKRPSHVMISDNPHL